MKKTDKTYILNVLSSHGEQKAIETLLSYFEEEAPKKSKDVEKIEIKKGNELIANALKWEKTPDGRYRPQNTSLLNLYRPENMMFHTSWDWLMPAINHCTQIGWRDQDDDSEIYEKFCSMFIDNSGMFLGNHIEEAWESVVNFINYLKNNVQTL